jgi:KEOPS complex subunit Cgi121
LIKEIEGFHKYIAISGFKNVKIKNVKTFLSAIRKELGDTCVQFFDARFITTREHLFFAALNALKAFENKMNISKSLAMETILYTSAQRQITKATKMLGIKAESQQVAVLIIAETKQKTTSTLEIVSKILPGDRDDDVLELGKKKFEAIKRLFGISGYELSAKSEETGVENEALVDLVIEHMALLATQR